MLLLRRLTSMFTKSKPKVNGYLVNWIIVNVLGTDVAVGTVYRDNRFSNGTVIVTQPVKSATDDAIQTDDSYYLLGSPKRECLESCELTPSTLRGVSSVTPTLLHFTNAP